MTNKPNGEAEGPGATPSWASDARGDGDRSAIEMALHASETSYRDLIDLAPDGIGIVLDGRVVYANRAGAQLLHASRWEDLLGLDLVERVHPDDRSEILRRQKWILDDGVTVSPLEIRVRCLDDRYTELEVRGGPCTFRGRRAIHVVARAIEERKRAALLLQRQNAILEQIAGDGPLPEILTQIVLMVEEQLRDKACSILLSNSAHTHLTFGAGPGLSPTMVALCEGLPVGPGIGSCGAAAYQGEPVFAADIAHDPDWVGFRDIILGDGFRACWSVPIMSRVTEEGKPVTLGTFGVYARQCGLPSTEVVDLLRRAEHLARIAIESDRAWRELRESETRFRTFVDHATGGFFLHDSDGTVLDVNRGACEALGYTREELVGMSPLEFDPEIGAAKVTDNHRRLQLGEAFSFDTRHRRKDGTTFPVEVRMQPFRSGARRLAIALVTDVTDRNRLQDQLRQSQKMEAMGRLAGGVAHDFNNLLTIINGYSELILQNLPEGSLLYERIVAIRDAGQRAAVLTTQLLAFGRKSMVETAIIELDALVRDAEGFWRRLIGEDIAFTVTIEADTLRVRADRGQIEQLIMNLIVNARDAMPRGGQLNLSVGYETFHQPTMRGEEQIAPGDYVRLSLADTGCGMTDEVRARIFEPFFTTKPIGQGSGLGLAVVHGVVRQTGGYIDVESCVDGGTAVHLFFPAATSALPSTDVKPLERSIGGTETILLVEDEEAVRAIVRLTLERRGYRVVAATGAIDALRQLGEHGGLIDLLLTDVVMPDMNGRELAEAVRAMVPSVRVLYMSGYTNDAFELRGVTDVADAFLQKPFTPESLEARVRNLLDARS